MSSVPDLSARAAYPVGAIQASKLAATMRNRHVSRRVRALGKLTGPVLVAAVVFTAAAPVRALPHPDDPIDPSKRAPISTKDAVRPSADAPTSSGIVGNGRIPEKRADIQVVSTEKTKAAIAVSETKTKSVTKPSQRTAKVRKQFKSTPASRLPASIPRLDAEQFSTALAAYREGKTAPPTLANLDVRVGKETVNIGAINRYANPRATLEAQGIPVVSAASGMPEEPNSAPVPIKKADGAASD